MQCFKWFIISTRLFFFHRSKTYMKGFTSRPKIPRTPEVHSNPSSARSTASSNDGVPPLTRSISPSRPDSSKGTLLIPLWFCKYFPCSLLSLDGNLYTVPYFYTFCSSVFAYESSPFYFIRSEAIESWFKQNVQMILTLDFYPRFLM